MTIVTNWYVTAGKEGVNLNQPLTINTTTNPEYAQGSSFTAAPPFQLGDRVQGINGSEWIFVQASATITANNLIAISNGFKATVLSSALAVSNQYSIGVAEFQVSTAATADFFWALLKANGGVAVNAVASTSTGSILFISNSPLGSITSTVTANALVGIAPVSGTLTTSASGPMEVRIMDYMWTSQDWLAAGSTV